MLALKPHFQCIFMPPWWILLEWKLNWSELLHTSMLFPFLFFNSISKMAIFCVFLKRLALVTQPDMQRSSSVVQQWIHSSTHAWKYQTIWHLFLFVKWQLQKDEPVGKAGMAEQRDLTGTKEGEILTCGRRARPLRSTTMMSWGYVGRKSEGPKHN